MYVNNTVRDEEFVRACLLFWISVQGSRFYYYIYDRSILMKPGHQKQRVAH